MSTTTYVTQSELKNQRDVFNNSIQLLSGEIKLRFNRIEPRLDGIEARLDRIEPRLGGIESRLDRIEPRLDLLEQQQGQALQALARLQNSSVTRLFNRVHSVKAYKPGHGFIEPKLFPKTAGDFYQLKHPKTNYQHRMLAYLVSFYEIDYDSTGLGDEADTSDPEGVIQGPELKVSLLEDILGLDESKFEPFVSRAQEFAARRTSPAKRPSDGPERDASRKAPPGGPGLASSPRWEPRQSTLAVRPDRHQVSSPPSEQVEVVWGERKTPSDRRPSINGLIDRKRRIERRDAIMPVSSGSPTNSTETKQPHTASQEE